MKTVSLYLFIAVLSLNSSYTSQAACDTQGVLRQVVSNPNTDASRQVNNEVLSLVNITRLKEYLPPVASIEEISTKDYADHFFNWMRSLEPKAFDVKSEIQQVVSNTKLIDLKSLERIAREKQFFRYRRVQAEVARLKMLATPDAILRAGTLEKALTKDGIAFGNGPHVEEVIHNVESNFESIAAALRTVHPYTQNELDHYFQYLKTLAAVHDLGKTFPDKLVEVAANTVAKVGGNPFVTNRIGFHEFSSAVRLKALQSQYKMDSKTVDSLIRNVLGHNDGSGLPDVFWNAVAFSEKQAGRYPLPETFASQVLALADRGGQATLGASGGVFKITRQQLSSGKVFGKELLEETMNKNATNTIRQIQTIAKNMGHGMDQSPMVRSLQGSQQKSLDAFQKIVWNSDQVSGVFLGKKFNTADEFLKIVAEQN
ncbi:MAG: hypothetical protein H7333_02925 [Bdellovibrionales bacterium]|nr:hypothetical protein [Oligoflexia bacterium]